MFSEVMRFLTGESELHTEDGVAIEDEDGNTIVFDSVVTATSPFAAVGGFDTSMFGQNCILLTLPWLLTIRAPVLLTR